MTDWRSRSLSRIASFSRSPAASPPVPAEMSYTDDIGAMLFPSEISQSIQAFLNNLTSPIHKAPFSPDRLTAMFQDFYAGTFEQVYDLLPEEIRSPADKGEMMTADEIAEHKLKREQAELKRQEWREEIESRVCLEMYDRIFELKTSTDEPRDEALMSKIIAMNLIGVTLEQLGVGLSDEEWSQMQPTVSLIGEELQSLNNALTPKTKIDILVACHKKIVDEVQHTNMADELATAIEPGDSQSTKSLEITIEVEHSRKHLGADAILPILIFSIIKSNPAKLVSHFQFIQRFRASSMLTGEAAYCLTNIEAAIGFLETFDDGNSLEHDPLRAATLYGSSLKGSNSTTSLATSIRAGDRARALSSAAQEVYDFADERVKSLGSQFGSQLGAFVNRVSQNHDLAEVRSLMGLPDVQEESASTGKQAYGTAEYRNSLSPSKMQATVQAQATKAGGSFGRLSGLGMIRNLSNSFSQRTTTEALKPPTRELQRSTGDIPVGAFDAARRSASVRFLKMDADDLTLGDVRELLEEYKRLLARD